MFKKAIIAVLGLIVSGIVVAGSMGPTCTPGNVTVPCDVKIWDLGAQALYLRSIYGSPKAFALNDISSDTEIHNDWNWGYRLEGSYHFNAGNDISINWLHFSTSVNATDLVGTLTLPGLGLTIPAPYELVSNDRIDQVNVVMGQHAALSTVDAIRFYGGLQYANIQSFATDYYILPAISGLLSTTFSLFDNTNYKGFGPLAGIDYTYYITPALSLTANGAGSILYGTNRYQAGVVVSPVEAITEQVFFRRKGIVPSLEAKLGANYSHPTAVGMANIQVGYQVINYFHALQAQSFQDLSAPVHSVNYGVFGPYFGLKLVGDA